MAKKPQQNPADIAKAAGKLAELKARLLFLLGALIVFRVVRGVLMSADMEQLDRWCWGSRLFSPMVLL